MRIYINTSLIFPLLIVLFLMSIINVTASFAQNSPANTLKGHTDWVESVAFSPDGTTLASGSLDSTVRLWDVATGTLKNTLEHRFGLLSIAFSPDGTLLASGDVAFTVHLWDVATGTLKNTLPGHRNVRDVSFSPDGTLLASGDADSIVRIWDVATGTLKNTFKHPFAITSVAFSPDGTTLASGSVDSTVGLWDVATGTLKNTLEHPSFVLSIAFSSDGTLLASGNRDKKVRIWDVATGTLKNTLEHPNWIYSVAFSPDGTLLASGNRDRKVRIWDVATGTLKNTFIEHTELVFSVAFSPDGTLLASGSADKKVLLWELTPATTPFTPSSVPDQTFTVGTPARFALPFASGGTAPYTYTLTPLPNGLRFDPATREIHGTPLTPTDTTSVTYTATDATGRDVALTFTITVTDAVTVPDPPIVPIYMSPSPVQSPAVGERLTFSLNITNGKNITGYQVTVQFDATALRYISSANGDYLPAGAFAVPAVATSNTVTVAATALAGSSNGDGTLATLTFEVVAAKASTVKLSEVLLTDSTGKVVTPQVEDGQITKLTEPQPLIADVNGDSVVNIQDLVLVATSFGQTGENAADVNGDGKVDVTDLVLVAGAVGKAAETPETTNNAPVFTEDDSPTRTVAENTAAGVNIGTPITATDADDDTLIYSLGGTDADTFSIDTTTGQLKTRGALDYETKSTYTLTITVSDGSLTDTITVTINITDIDETPLDAQDIIVSLSPSPVQLPAVGEQLTLNLNIANGKDIVGYQVTLQFDPTALRYVSSADAGYLPGAFALPAVVTANSVTLVATSFAEESDGDGTLATITFEIVAAKASTIRLTSVTLSDSAANPLQVTSTDGIVTGTDAVDLVSGRTPQVRDAIVSAAGVGSAAEVTAAHLAAIEQLDLNNKGITALKASDFDGFTGLTGLDLGGNDFNTGLLQDIFDKLTSLIVLILPDNNATAQLIEKFGGQVLSLRSDDFIVQPNELQGTMILFKVPSPPTVAGEVGDVNLDGIVNIQDLVHVIRNFGKTGENIADTNDDSVVDIADLVNVVGSFGQLSNAAPSLSSKVITSLTPTEIEELLTQIRKLDLTNPMVQQWVTTLEHLLATLTPKETALLANYPNPFNPETWIPYQLAESADVTLRIHAVDGTSVRTLLLGHKAIGTYQSRNRAAYWDGKNEFGEPVASGVYFYTLIAGDFTATRKMLIRK